MRVMLTDGLRKVLYTPAMIFRSLAKTGIQPNAFTASNASPATRSGFLNRAIGWPPAKVDVLRETAWLDGLRGIAAFFVLALHLNMVIFLFVAEAPFGSTIQGQTTPTYALWRLPFIRYFFVSGHAQVGVFFVISGFVLSWSSLEHIRTGNTERLANSLSSAVLRRWFRLYLPCFAGGLLSFVRIRMGLDTPGGMHIYSNVFRQLWDYILACEAFARPVLRDRKFPDWLLTYNWVTWTIPLEFEGSLMVFVLLLSMAKVRQYRIRFLILLVWTFYACVLAQWSYWLFAAGTLLADFVKEAGGFARLTQKMTGLYKMACWLVFATGIWMACVPATSPFYNRPGYEFLDQFTPKLYSSIEDGNRFWWSLAGILIVYSACGLQPVRSLCESRLAQYLGQISYMLYLTHQGFPLDITLFMVRRCRMSWSTSHWDPQMKIDIYEMSLVPEIILYLLTWIMMIATSIPLAYWCYVLFDKSSVRIAKRIEVWLTGGGSGSGRTDGSAPSMQTRGRGIDGREHETVALLPV